VPTGVAVLTIEYDVVAFVTNYPVCFTVQAARAWAACSTS